MRYCLLFIILISSVFFSCSHEQEVVSYVNPFIGTGAHGHTYPGATTPFGMVQLSPDTRVGNWDACSGYHHSDSTIIGFSHTHLSGTGCIDLGDILIRPTTQNLAKKSERMHLTPVSFSHDNEFAEPGYYKVKLDDENIYCELSATTHVGIHRYTFPKGENAKILIDLSHQLENESMKLGIESITDNEVSGYRFSKGWSEAQKLFFVARFSNKFASKSIVSENKIIQDLPIESKDIRVLLNWEDLPNDQVEIHIGISAVSIEGARNNLNEEASEFNFEKYRKESRLNWQNQLDKIKVKSSSHREKEIFYTALYRSSVAPTVISDVDGKYRGMDQEVYQDKNQKHYTAFSLWDTFRAWHPLMTILDDKFVTEMINSMLANYEQTGELPIWPLWGSETGTMIGYHSVSVIADAWMKGIRGFNQELAMEAMVASSKTNRKGNDLYREIGFIPANSKRESVSCLLEYAYDDWCIARFAEAIGEKPIAEEYRQRAFYYNNVFDGNTSFFRGKKENGDWVSPFNPFEVSRDMTEATAWQYRFFVPHDVQGMINLFGGKNKFIQALDDLFNANSELEGELSDITGLIGQYAHGNEPSHHMAYLYSYVGQAWKTQYWVNRLQNEMYDNSPEGIIGNEDCGQMSAWYIMSSLGFYSVCPGSNEYILNTPRFSEIMLNLGNGKILNIETDKDPLKYIYINKIKLNGVELKTPFINHQQVLEGGKLEFELSDKPRKNDEELNQTVPYSLSKSRAVSVPYLTSNVDQFINSCKIEMGVATDSAEIYYTLDGSEPTKQSLKYNASFLLKESAIIKMKAYKNDYEPSSISTIQAQKAVFLPAIRGKELKKHGVTYWYFEGSYTKTADLESQQAIETGVMNNFLIESARLEDHFGFKYETYIKIPEDGLYEFYTISDDGSVLFIDGQKVVDNDGGHAAVKATGVVALRKGVHRLNVTYFEDYEGNSLEVGMNDVGKPARRFKDSDLWF